MGCFHSKEAVSMGFVSALGPQWSALAVGADARTLNLLMEVALQQQRLGAQHSLQSGSSSLEGHMQQPNNSLRTHPSGEVAVVSCRGSGRASHSSGGGADTRMYVQSPASSISNKAAAGNVLWGLSPIKEVPPGSTVAVRRQDSRSSPACSMTRAPSVLGLGDTAGLPPARQRSTVRASPTGPTIRQQSKLSSTTFSNSSPCITAIPCSEVPAGAASSISSQQGWTRQDDAIDAPCTPQHQISRLEQLAAPDSPARSLPQHSSAPTAAVAHAAEAADTSHSNLSLSKPMLSDPTAVLLSHEATCGAASPPSPPISRMRSSSVTAAAAQARRVSWAPLPAGSSYSSCGSVVRPSGGAAAAATAVPMSAHAAAGMVNLQTPPMHERRMLPDVAEALECAIGSMTHQGRMLQSLPMRPQQPQQQLRRCVTQAEAPVVTVAYPTAIPYSSSRLGSGSIHAASMAQSPPVDARSTRTLSNTTLTCPTPISTQEDAAQHPPTVCPPAAFMHGVQPPLANYGLEHSPAAMQGGAVGPRGPVAMYHAPGLRQYGYERSNSAVMESVRHSPPSRTAPPRRLLSVLPASSTTHLHPAASAAAAAAGMRGAAGGLCLSHHESLRARVHLDACIRADGFIRSMASAEGPRSTGTPGEAHGQGARPSGHQLSVQPLLEARLREQQQQMEAGMCRDPRQMELLRQQQHLAASAHAWQMQQPLPQQQQQQHGHKGLRYGTLLLQQAQQTQQAQQMQQARVGQRQAVP